MKKGFSYIVVFIMGIITATSIGVAAYTISAKEIGYSPKDSSWKVNNVADAIESLKTLKGGSTNYSTEEQVVGTWIDGKPVYQKTLQTGAIQSGQAKNVLSDSTIDSVIDIWGFGIQENSSIIIPVPRAGGTSGVVAIGWFFNAGNLKIELSNNQIAISNSFITLQYTKTTDNATNS